MIVHEELDQTPADSAPLETRAVLDAVSDGVVSIDERGRAVYVNAAAARLLRLPSTARANGAAHDLFHPILGSRRTCSAAPCPFATLPRTASEGGTETLWTLDGRPVPVRYRVTSVGGSAGAVVTFSPLRDGSRAEDELALARAELHRAQLERRRLLYSVVRVQEEERKRIASDIHDDPLQVMATVRMRLEMLGHRLKDPEELRSLEKLEDTIELCINRLRHLLFEFSPLTLERDGLAAAVEVYLQQAKAQGAFDYRLRNRFGRTSSQDTETIAYRIAQEALANVAKHANASVVDVVLERMCAGLYVRIADDGVGISPAHQTGGGFGHLGVHAMRERAETAGGWFRLDGEPGRGTSVEFWLPLAEDDRRIVLTDEGEMTPVARTEL